MELETEGGVVICIGTCALLWLSLLLMLSLLLAVELLFVLLLLYE